MSGTLQECGDRLTRLTTEVVGWADNIAPDRRPIDAAIKAVAEVAELLDAVANKSAHEVSKEIGDVMILLLDIANMYDIDPVNAGQYKMGINKSRKYYADEKGVMRRDK